jgi:hypothetical protein
MAGFMEPYRSAGTVASRRMFRRTLVRRAAHRGVDVVDAADAARFGLAEELES